jgi:Tfp pilus assembly protein PilF
MVEERIKIARTHMDRGEYAEALTELEKASKIDPTNKDVQNVISDTRRACNAEKRLGRSDLRC